MASGSFALPGPSAALLPRRSLRMTGACTCPLLCRPELDAAVEEALGYLQRLQEKEGDGLK